VRIVVLGAGGQLGRELARVLPRETTLLPRRELDVRDAAAVASALAATRAEVIVNAAADNRVDAAESDPSAAFATNATGAAHGPFIRVRFGDQIENDSPQPQVFFAFGLRN
jgi:dTDP-4-dehydrorhamnose reductase